MPRKRSRQSIPPSPAPAARPGWQERLALPFVIGVALIACIAGIANEFVQDDFRLIQENSRVHGLDRWREILSSPYWPPPWHQELYRPVLTLFHAVQFVLASGSPFLFRVVSYLLYCATAIAVLYLGRRLLPPGIALGIALLFAAHPVHVEAVALAVGQGELLVCLLAIGMTIRYVDRRRSGPLATGDWVTLAVLFVVASMIKEQGLLIPALLLSAEACLLTGPLAPRIRAVGGGFAVLGGLALLIVLLRRAVLGGEFSGVFVSEALQGRTFGDRALTLLQIVPQWARLLVWPRHLQADYAPQELVASTGFGLREAVGLLLLAISLAGAWLARRRAPAVTFGLIWMAITLFPVSNLLAPTGFLLAERTLFLPSVGFTLAIGGLVALRPARELAIACAALVILGVVRSAERQRVWRDEAFFAVRSVQDAPRSYRTQRAYGEVLFLLGRQDLALEAYERSKALAPAGSAWRVRNDLARRYRAMGETGREIVELEGSLAESPAQDDTRGHLIAALLLLGRYADAARQVDTALARGGRPEVFRGLRALADSAQRVGAPPGSIRVRPVTEPAR